MEISSIRELPELGIMDDPSFLHQWHLNSFDSYSLAAATFGDTLQKHSLFSNDNTNFIPKTFMETSPSVVEKQVKTSSWNHNSTSAAPSSETSSDQSQFGSCSNLLSFVDCTNYTSHQLGLVKPKVEMVMSPKIDTTTTTTPADHMLISQNFGNQNYVFKACHEAKNNIAARPRISQAHDHIIAERKRREKLSQRFIALSALVPGLKKMDKASVLGDAIKYLKQMQEKVSALEEEQNRKKTVESVVVVKKSQLSNNDSEDSCLDTFDEALPEIEARFSERNVLIRVHCEKNKGVIEKTINEIEKLHLKVINSNALTFGSFALDITIIALMDMEFSMTVKELVRNLRSAFASFM